MKYKLFCTVNMETYYIEAESRYEARKKLSKKLNVPIQCIIDYD